MMFYVNGEVREASRKEWPPEWGSELGELWGIQGPNLHPGQEVQWSGENPTGSLWVQVQVSFPPLDQPKAGYLRLRDEDRFHA